MLDAALRPDVAGRDLESRIQRLTLGEIRAAGAADARFAGRLEASLVPPHVVPADLEPRVLAASVDALRSRWAIGATSVGGAVASSSAAVLAVPAVAAGSTVPGRHRSVLGRVGAFRVAAGRLAMAASFGVLAFAGWWTARSQPVMPGPLPVERVLAADLGELDDVSWASLEDSTAVEAELALLEGWDVGSFADVAGEIEAIIPDFLMADAGR